MVEVAFSERANYGSSVAIPLNHAQGPPGVDASTSPQPYGVSRMCIA